MEKKPVSPYGVAAASVADAPRLSPSDPLAPFEQDQVNRLVNQINAAHYRVRDAVLAQITPPALASGLPKVVRFRG